MHAHAHTYTLTPQAPEWLYVLLALPTCPCWAAQREKIRHRGRGLNFAIFGALVHEVVTVMPASQLDRATITVGDTVTWGESNST